MGHHYGYMLASRPGDVELHTWIWDKVNHCEMKVPWLVFMQVRHHFGFTIDPRPGDKCLHHPIWDRINNCFMRVPRPVYLKVKKYYQDEVTYIFDRINGVPMKVFWSN